MIQLSLVLLILLFLLQYCINIITIVVINLCSEKSKSIVIILSLFTANHIFLKVVIACIKYIFVVLSFIL